MHPAIEALRLRKTFHGGDFWAPRHWTAVDGVSLSVAAGSIYGLLGPNGAGKTTTVKLMVGLLRPDEGAVRVLSGDPRDPAVRSRIGYVSEFPHFPRNLTPLEILRFYAGLFGLRGRAAADRADEVLVEVGLAGLGARRIAELSKGQRQRVGWAQGILNDPEVLFVDEPLSGLDPIGVYEMRELILRQKARKRTLFFNSHILSEMEKVCDDVGILVSGRLADALGMAAVRARGGLERVFLRTVRAASGPPGRGGR